MPALADIIRAAGPAYRAAHHDRLLPSQRRALHDIGACRTAALGGSLYACDQCGTLDYRYHSCRNRHCPTCQQDRAQDWLTRLRTRLLPCDHHLLTFTLPQELRALALTHQKQVYALLLQTAAAAVQTLAADPAWVGGTPGILAVLHTWSRTLTYHPHVHLLVTAGGLSPDGSWRKPAHPRFLMPGYVLSRIFRTKLRAAVSRAGLTDAIDPAVWDRAWVVHVQSTGRGEYAALYLSRYIYRVALGNDRIERFGNGQVTFRYTHARTHETRRITLPVDDFLDRFLLHVLPRGFAKVRSYGLLSPTHRTQLEHARQILEHHDAATSPARSPTTACTQIPTATPSPQLTDSTPAGCCPACHCSRMRFVHRFRSRAPP
ncbi:MAG: IS91 family transposase [Gemmatimonadota bacterium]